MEEATSVGLFWEQLWTLHSLLDFIRVGVPSMGFLGMIVSVFIVESQIRRKKGLYPYKDAGMKREHAFLRWSFIAAMLFGLHSVLMSNPVSYDPQDSSESTGIPHITWGFAKGAAELFMESYTTGIFNVVHGIFMLGVSYRFLEGKKALYIHFIMVGHYMMSLPCIVASLLTFIQVWFFPTTQSLINLILAIAAAFIFIMTARAATLASRSIIKDGNDKRFAAALKKKRKLARTNQREDPATEGLTNENEDADVDNEDEGRRQRSDQSEKDLQEIKYVEGIIAKVALWRKLLLMVQSCEVITFVIYYVMLFAVRLPEAWDTAVPTGSFVTGLVAGYISALHHAFILGFGIHGALCYNPSALRMYGFAQALFCGLDVLWVIGSCYRLSDGDSLLLLATILWTGSRVVLQFISIWLCMMYRIQLPEAVSEASKEDDNIRPDALDSNERRSWDCAKWAIALIVWWHVEAIVIAVLQLYSVFSFSISSVAINFGLHGMVVYLVTAFKSNQAVSDYMYRSRKRFHFGMYSLFGFLSMSQVISMLTYSRWDTAVLIYFCLATVRCGLCFRTAFAFLWASNANDGAAPPSSIEMSDLKLQDEEDQRVLYHNKERATPSASSHSLGFFPEEDEDSSGAMTTIIANSEEINSTNSSGQALSKRKNSKKSEKQRLVVPVPNEDHDADVNDKDGEEEGGPPAVSMVTLPPWVERLRWWTERLGGWYGWAFLIFVWLLMWEEMHDYTGLVSSLYTIKDLGGFSQAYSVAYHQCFLAAGHGLLGPRLLNKGFMFLFWLVSCSAMIVSFACAVVAFLHATEVGFTIINTIGILVFLLLSWSGLAGWVTAYSLRGVLIKLDAPATPVVW